MDLNKIKWTPAELVVWHIFIIALGAGLMGGAPALLQYFASSNVDVTLCLKLALAGALSAFTGSILMYFRKNGKAFQTVIQAVLDLGGQINDAVTTQVIATPPARAVEPQPIVLVPQPVQMPIQPAQTTYVQPNLDATASPPLYMPNLNATAAVPSSPPAWQTDLHFGDSFPNLPAIPKP